MFSVNQFAAQFITRSIVSSVSLETRKRNYRQPPSTIYQPATGRWCVPDVRLSLTLWLSDSRFPFLSLSPQRVRRGNCNGPLAYHADSSVVAVTPFGRNTYWSSKRFHYIAGRDSCQSFLNPFCSDQSILIDTFCVRPLHLSLERLFYLSYSLSFRSKFESKTSMYLSFILGRHLLLRNKDPSDITLLYVNTVQSKCDEGVMLEST